MSDLVVQQNRSSQDSSLDAASWHSHDVRESESRKATIRRSCSNAGDTTTTTTTTTKIRTENQRNKKESFSGRKKVASSLTTVQMERGNNRSITSTFPITNRRGSAGFSQITDDGKWADQLIHQYSDSETESVNTQQQLASLLGEPTKTAATAAAASHKIPSQLQVHPTSTKVDEDDVSWFSETECTDTEETDADEKKQHSDHDRRHRRRHGGSQYHILHALVALTLDQG
jgi:hypothetical protein